MNTQPPAETEAYWVALCKKTIEILGHAKRLHAQLDPLVHVKRRSGKTHLSAPGVNKAYMNIERYCNRSEAELSSLITDLKNLDVSEEYISLVEDLEKQLQKLVLSNIKRLFPVRLLIITRPAATQTCISSITGAVMMRSYLR